MSTILLLHFLNESHGLAECAEISKIGRLPRGSGDGAGFPQGEGGDGGPLLLSVCLEDEDALLVHHLVPDPELPVQVQLAVPAALAVLQMQSSAAAESADS